MTHAESQDLLLDLAYGELDPERAAEVKSHLEGCAECRKEKEALDEARRLAAPLRELEEPSPGFDDRIRAAARAQAQLEHDGNVGKVIEVAGTIRPLGLDPARIDAHGPVKARPAQRHRPRWIARAAVGGSVAAAAALAMVVGNTLETRRMARVAAEAPSDEFKIRVQPAITESVDKALRDAESNRSDADAQRVKKEPQALNEPPPAGQEKEKLGELRGPPPGVRRKVASTPGSGGDAPAKSGTKDAETVRPGYKSASSQSSPRSAVPLAGPDALSPPPPAAPNVQQRSVQRKAPATERQRIDVANEAGVEGRVVAGEAGGAVASMAAPAADALETSAQQARHAGDYVRAASLYQDAAQARGRESNAAAAAWNLAHAVECLSAAGRFDEARRVRDELARLYPAEAPALSAARRALREVDPPVSNP